MYKKFIKRCIDLFVSFLAILVLAPVLLLLALLLSVVNNGKPFFYQNRPGKGEHIFKIVKFKTMTDARDTEGNLLPDKDRITTVGKFVRKTSLDEIPQLFNVLIGDMSLIGPRPLLIAYLPRYNATQKRRHEVRPGITGWAQVNGRNAISWPQKFAYDIWYVDHVSFGVDMKILWLTVLKVVKREGISSATSATMEAFMGNESQ
jgi:lipopolysaccharide/colanic/teichoic acid biosynthesis glycosyltransferase